ncbi:hypothetical protein [Rummeliibacillus stabekisii]|uniref:Flagellar hook-length control protein-like C-terminal domain-containing protein n=1 Tax=Rummeliibacillus stabekisii TaxID=241244 RepID=A0A143H9J5_9BACL|nr:hypothetical protein [Rummeliibacillus stabekisii]AMW98404.1 hypothetical protein ATY39_02540 [Rummeliibacillus stabekisii]
MNYPSLNSVQLGQTMVNNQQPLTLKQGQVIHGTIKQLFPNQMAEIQIGGQKLIAKLEIPLQAGNAHYFQVSGTEPDLQLKVISNPMSSAMPLTQQADQLLNALGLNQTTSLKELASFFLQNNLPLSKELFLQAEELLKNLPDNLGTKEALQIIQKLIAHKLPIQQGTFQAVLEGNMKTGFADLLKNFQQVVKTDETISMGMKNQLLNQLEQINNPLLKETGGILLGKMVEALSSEQTLPENKAAILQALKDVGVIPQTARLSNWQQEILQQPASSGATSDPINNKTEQPIELRTIVKLLQALEQQPTTQDKGQLIGQIQTAIEKNTLLTTEQKSNLIQLAQQSTSTKDIAQTKAVITQLQEQLLKAASENAIVKPFEVDDKGISAKHQLLQLLGQEDNSERLFNHLTKYTLESKSTHLRGMLQETENQLANNLNGKAIQATIKDLFKGLGLSYEAKLADASSDIRQFAEQLKPQLIGLLQNGVISDATKDLAKQVSARLDGMQYLSTELGPEQQLIMQLPLNFLGRQSEATLQWSGRKSADGKIDADFARILFYLQLHSLKETVVDMQVQSRIVTINIYNDNEGLKNLAAPLKALLKENLARHDYQLSGLIFKDQQEIAKSNSINLFQSSNAEQRRVDFKI